MRSLANWNRLQVLLIQLTACLAIKNLLPHCHSKFHNQKDCTSQMASNSNLNLMFFCSAIHSVFTVWASESKLSRFFWTAKKLKMDSVLRLGMRNAYIGQMKSPLTTILRRGYEVAQNIITCSLFP